MKNKAIYFTVLVALILVVGLLASFSLNESATAAPSAAPTPITVSRNNGEPQFLEWYRFGRIRADTRACLETWGYESLEVQTRYQMDSGVNTTTMRVQVTNDQLWFVNGPTILNAVVTHTTDFTPIPSQGRYTCFFFDVSNNLTTTIWLNAVGK